MAKTSKSSVVVAPQSAQVVAPSAPQEVRKTRKRKARKQQYCSPDGKVARGLTEAPVDFNPATQRLARGQFKTMAQWYTHCAAQAQRRADMYQDLAQDALQNPGKYGRAKAQATKGALLGKIAALEALLQSKGFSAQDIAALVGAEVE